MYYKVTYTVEDKKHREKTKTALFIDEQAAKRFQDQLWKDKSVTHAEVQGGFDSKGNKI
jgi:hypothetical protein